MVAFTFKIFFLKVNVPLVSITPSLRIIIDLAFLILVTADTNAIPSEPISDALSPISK